MGGTQGILGLELSGIGGRREGLNCHKNHKNHQNKQGWDTMDPEARVLGYRWKERGEACIVIRIPKKDGGKTVDPRD